jgi:hypothetical protein
MGLRSGGLRWAIVAVAKNDAVNRGEDARMEWLVWTGTALAVAGFGLGYCIVAAISAKRAGLPDPELRGRLARIVSINVGALLVSVLGLMSVVVGVFLT